MIGTGDQISDVLLKTDEGTPLSLSDFKGRSVALFFVGKTITQSTEMLFEELAKRLEQFLNLDISPLIISGESAAQLAAYRNKKDVPFVLLSDERFKFHTELGYGKPGAPTFLLIDNNSVVIDMVPFLPPVEQVSVAEERALKLSSKKEVMC